MSEHKNALSNGTVIDKYKIESIIAHGGFGIVYKARHSHLDEVVVIKEYLPSEVATREGTTVHPLSGSVENDYQDGLDRFLAEAKQLIQFKQHPNIVSCRDFFALNGTAYLVMDFEEGLSLSELMKARKNDPLSEEHLLKMMLALLDGLAFVHEKGVLHRDIKPGNIFIRRADELPLLIDFGAAKQNFSKHSKSMAPFTVGYAPMEQISDDGELGPWTDIYAIGAVMWRIISGQNPVDVNKRLTAVIKGKPDPFVSAKEVAGNNYSEELLTIIDKCTALNDSDRYQSVNELISALHKINNVEILAPIEPAKENKKPKAKKSHNSHVTESKKPLLKRVAVFTGLAVIFGGAIFAFQASNELTKGKAVLHINSQPRGANLYLDEHLLGQTPYVGSFLPAGKHTIKLTHADYQDMNKTITLEDNVISKEKFKLKLATGNFSVFSTPEGARIYVDYKYTQKTTPATLLNITAGKHVLTLKKDKFYNLKENIYVQKKQTLKGDYTLKGGDLVKYRGRWMKPDEVAEHKQVIADAKAKRIAELKAIQVAKDKATAKAAAVAATARKYVGKMVKIPSGSFRMGSTYSTDEKPVHSVKLSAFKMMSKEVTFNQYDAYARAVGKSKPKDNGFGRGNRPVIHVTWQNARNFAKWVSKQTGTRFRLPTESEWEYAARAGSRSKYSWGNSVSCSKAQYSGTKSSGCYYKNDGVLNGTARVGSYSSNDFGLYDMHGNVWEWTQDCYNDNYKGAPKNGSAWLTGNCNKRIVRGGGWTSNHKGIRVANRRPETATNKKYKFGFRLVQEIN